MFRGQGRITLGEYRKKRDFRKTSEPPGAEGEGGRSIYVIQKHHARNLHFDLRLEMDGVLKSWAIPKMPQTEVGFKRLAVQTEDHPIEYASFEGTIPEGEYGAGTVEIWDRGRYVLKERSKDKLVFEIKGRRLSGDYCLIRFKGKQNWLFFKKKSEAV